MITTRETSDKSPTHPAAIPELSMIIASDEMRALMLLVDRVARSLASVLITGESGTGKELIARAIHLKSPRRDRPFIDLNCAALPEHLIESELFGYEKGAFSGADQSKPGMFELANHGTLFLDEIGEIDSKIQAKLLRVLDGNPYYRLGGKQKIVTDVRVISATNRPLEGNNNNGRFRLDLYYRLAQFQLQIPALRERVQDILPIAESYLGNLAPESVLSESAKAALLAYEWPGNVRELRNVIVQAITVAGPGEISTEHLPGHVAGNSQLVPLIQRANTGSSLDLEQIEREAIQQAMISTGGHQGKAAERLGISRRTLTRRLREYRGKLKEQNAPLGVLSPEQQQFFRAEARVPARIRGANGEVLATVTNISSGGAGLENFDARICGEDDGVIDLAISLSERAAIQAKGTIVWSRPDGKAGVRFSTIDPASKRFLEEWIAGKIVEEGWTSAAGANADVR